MTSEKVESALKLFDATLIYHTSKSQMPEPYFSHCYRVVGTLLYSNSHKSIPYSYMVKRKRSIKSKINSKHKRTLISNARSYSAPN